MRRSSVTLNLVRRALSSLSNRGAAVSETLTSCPPQALPPNRISCPAVSYPVIQSPASLWQCRTLSSSSGSSNICLVKSADEFNAALSNTQDDSGSAVFYFTAAWCGPCRFISPVIEALSEKYPHVKIYKIDIDQEGIQDKLFELRIDSVPRLNFFHKGKKVDEIVGADVERLKYTMERLYQ